MEAKVEMVRKLPEVEVEEGLVVVLLFYIIKGF